MDAPSPYQRVLLKISGESFCKRGEMGITPDSLSHIASEIVEAAQSGVQIAVVTGGGNMIRGADLSAKLAIDQSTTDYMGMLGTVMNGMALKERLEQLGQPARLMSAIDLPALAESFVRKRALRHFEKGRIVILAAGTGNPFFTTDTCASLRATELNCDVLLKGTKVDGIYSEDPAKNPDAKRYETLSFREAVDKQLGVMDITAMSMCMEQNLPIVVFNYQDAGNIRRVVQGEQIGTTVSKNGAIQVATT
ncbi:MAG: UMP kinase [Phycisphaerales bacterium]|nr:UMP kinase [Phycisphaerales bacterium]|tara:strand:- start:190 stop:939 length:750 start_codon:yes stop_codon:yes gene_type:complete